MLLQQGNAARKTLLPGRTSKICRLQILLDPLRKTIQNTGPHLRNARSADKALFALLIAIAALTAARPALLQAETSVPAHVIAALPLAAVESTDKQGESNAGPLGPAYRPLLVIGFMGGRIHAGNLAHGEARLAQDLDQRYPQAVHALTFANHREHEALRTVLELLNTSNDGCLSDAEKNAARIILFGHSWGASEAIHLAQELDRRGIPVLLTIQVDSVEKSGESDGFIPANVREAVNFYQAEGLLHGRRVIRAIDPARTTILGNYKASYKSNPVSCAGYGWFARAFMKPHIEIENDHALWDRIETLIVARSCVVNLAGLASACTEK
jgi:hypothetical protein